MKLPKASDEEDGYWVCDEVDKFIEIPVGMVSLMVLLQRFLCIQYAVLKSENNFNRLLYIVGQNFFAPEPNKIYSNIIDVSRYNQKNYMRHDGIQHRRNSLIYKDLLNVKGTR